VEQSLLLTDRRDTGENLEPSIEEEVGEVRVVGGAVEVSPGCQPQCNMA
jgi:hypothetical protein